MRGHGADEPYPLGIGHDGSEAPLGLMERLDRDEHHLGSQSGVRGQCRVLRCRTVALDTGSVYG